MLSIDLLVLIILEEMTQIIFLRDLIPSQQSLTVQVGQFYPSSLSEALTLSACNPGLWATGTLFAPHTMAQFSALSKQGM